MTVVLVELLTGMSDREITAQCLLLVLAGWSTSSMSLSFLMHQLAVHPRYQDRAVAEVDAKIGLEVRTIISKLIVCGNRNFSSFHKKKQTEYFLLNRI